MKKSLDNDHFEPGSKRMSGSGIRINNERAVLTAAAVTPGSSSAEIARETGLGPQTVSRILSDLEMQGLVMRGDVRRGQRGQPATPIYLDPNGVYTIGCEIGWRHIEVILRNLGGEILGHHRRDYPFPDATVVFQELGSVSRLLTGLIPEGFRDRLLGVGLAMPGGIFRNIDLLGGSAKDAQAWVDLDIVAKAEEATGLKVFFFNDGNAACWAELAAVPPPRPNNLAYILVSTFVGAGIIAEGRLWEGPTGNSANLGSIIVTDRLGNQNFVHLIASIMALETKLFAAGVAVPAGNPRDWNWESLEPHVTEWIDEASPAIAKAIANTSAVIEFGTAIVDGVMPRAVVDRLIERIRHHTLELPVLTSDRPTIISGRLGGLAPARGAALLPIYRAYFSRDWDHVQGEN